MRVVVFGGGCSLAAADSVAADPAGRKVDVFGGIAP
jgi:hypothetical protein